MFYFFLQKTIAPTGSEQQPTTGDESEEMFLDGASNQTSTNSTNDQQPSTSSFGDTKPTGRPISRKRKKKVTPNVDDDDDNAQSELMTKCIKILSDDEKPKDSLATFGEYVASELRRYAGDEILQIQTQNSIQRILMDATEKYLSKKYLIVNSDGSLSPFNISEASTSTTTATNPVTPMTPIDHDAMEKEVIAAIVEPNNELHTETDSNAKIVEQDNVIQDI